MSEWIDCDLRTPRDDNFVLVYRPSEVPQMEVDWIDGDGNWAVSNFCTVTHWMPLPSPPSAGEQPEQTEFRTCECGKEQQLCGSISGLYCQRCHLYVSKDARGYGKPVPYASTVGEKSI